MSEEIAKTAEQKEELSMLTALENMDQGNAVMIVSDLIEEVDYGYFALGGAFTIIHEEAWWRLPDSDGIPAYESFKEFVEHQFGISYRKAMYFKTIYERIMNSGVPLEDILSLGWTKVRDLSEIINKDNYDKWIEHAKEMNTIQLRDEIKAAKMAALSGGENVEPVEGVKKVTTFSCKVHEDQKETINLAIEKAKEEGGTEFAGVALEGICIAYMSGVSVPLKQSETKGEQPAEDQLRTIMKGMNPVDVLEVVDGMWPDVNLSAELPEKYISMTVKDKLDDEL